jgi:hypothetical protein
MLSVKFTWLEAAVATALVLAVAAATTLARRRSGSPRLAGIAVFAREAGMLLGLFALGTPVHRRPAGARGQDRVQPGRPMLVHPPHREPGRLREVTADADADGHRREAALERGGLCAPSTVTSRPAGPRIPAAAVTMSSAQSGCLISRWAAARPAIIGSTSVIRGTW